MLLKPRVYGSRPLLSVVFILLSIFLIELFVKHFVELIHSNHIFHYLLIKAVLLIPMLYFFVCKPISHYIGQLVDTKEELGRINKKFARSRDFYLTLFEEFPAMIWRSGLDAKPDYFNKEWLNFTGRTLEEELETGWTDGVHPEDLDRYVKFYLDSFKARKPFKMEFRLRRYNGEYRWIAGHGRAYYDLDGNFAGYIGSCYDITDRKQLEEKAWHQAFHDTLTGLPNRLLFIDRLNLALAHNSRHSTMLALMFIDLDQFKPINDTHGHDAGDKVLIEFAKILTECVREEDTVARMGGDEFMILLPQINSQEDTIIVAKRILDSFKEPWVINGSYFNISPSIGISIYPLDGENAEVLIKKADTAMYQAKEVGNVYRFA